MATPVEGTSPAPQLTVDQLIAELFVGSTQDPFPLYDELRELGEGVHWVEFLGSYLVTRYHDVRRVGADWKTFSSDIFHTAPTGIHDATDPEHRRFIEIASQLFMFADPPAHTRIRSTFRHSFTPDAVNGWSSIVEQITDEVLARYTAGQEIDVMPELAADVPVAVIAAILGVPPDRMSQFRNWSSAFGSTFDPLVLDERRDAAIRTSLELFDYIHGLTEQRTTQPGTDLISQMIAAGTTDGRGLDDRELVAQVALLLAAGNETTTNLIGNGLSLLMDHPDAMASLVADPTRVPTAVEEMLRFDPPLHFSIRRVTTPVTLGGQDMDTGSLMFVCIPAANRDPRAFAHSDVFDIDRTDNQHLAFFHGIHYCVGAPLARLEATMVFEKLLRRFPTVAPGTQPAVRRTANAVSRGWISRPVTL